MPIHTRILEAVLRICRERGGWTFRPAEIVAALPDLNVASVRTHVMSRCCANAPSNHPHRWPYFRRVRRGVYEVRREWRKGRGEGRDGRERRSGTGYEPALDIHGVAASGEGFPGGPGSGWIGGVADSPGGPGARAAGAVESSRGLAARPGSGGHAQPEAGGSMYRRPSAGFVVEVREVAGEYRAEIPGRPDPIRSASLDDAVMRIRDALREGGRAPSGPSVPIHLDVRLEPERIDPVIAEYMKGFDRTLVIQSLKMSYEERLLTLQSLLNAAEEIRGAAWKTKKKSGL